ncbi:MAG: FtsH protease activity modulator HflK [Spartobacteria bacterium]|nr:FtsH protease activity modulator HflK [Spartobacteria bacterium]
MERDTEQIYSGYTALAEALKTSFRLLRWALALLFVAYLASGIFVVSQHEQAVVLIFGRLAGMPGRQALGPGLHWTFPAPIAEVITVPTERVQAIASDSFWYALSARDRLSAHPPPPGPNLNPLTDGYTLSGDANLLHSQWILRYTIDDAIAYLFRFGAMEQFLRDELDHAVVKASARFNVDQALRTDIERFRNQVEQELKRRMEALKPGIQIERVDLTLIAPPRQVAAAFDSVIKAEQDRSRQISEARAYATRAKNESVGEANRLLSEARTYRNQRVSEVSANADYFSQVYEQFKENPSITAEVLYQNAIRRVLQNAEQKFMVSKSSDGSQELRILLGRDPEKRQKK